MLKCSQDVANDGLRCETEQLMVECKIKLDQVGQLVQLINPKLIVNHNLIEVLQIKLDFLQWFI